MAQHEYSAAEITVLEFDEVVLKRPGMYFGVGLDDPGLPVTLLSVAAQHALHPAAHVAEDHSLTSVIEILGDLRFAVTINQRHTWPDSPPLGYHGSLIGPEWWSLAAIAALCGTTTAEMWCDGRGFGQELAGLRPRTAVWRFEPPPGSGTRVTFTLDARRLPPGTAFPADLGGLTVHGPYCDAADGPGTVAVHDSRNGPGIGASFF
ncbi:hypothetical protein ABT340_21070 [Streptosporangium sp. NPDC000239]|uniref:hypothetical protein n=1 Tax=Streptosporangium sp. NPDC000239 TaxID=3154248 RepID=UPI003319DA04